MRMILLVTACMGSCFVLLFGGCGEPPIKQETVVRPVKIHVIGSLEPEAIIEYPGTIRAKQTAEMGFEVAGRVVEFLVKEGVEVKKDAVLAKLDPRDYEAELKVAMANLEKAKSELVRSENINRKQPGAISVDEIESSRRIVKVAEAELAIAQKAVADTELRAPFDGVVARKVVEDFANVQAKEPVLVLQDNSTLEIVVAVPERDFVGGKYRDLPLEKKTELLAPQVIVSALPDRKFPARITEYATMADPITRTFDVRLAFDNPNDVNILPGMTARVRIIIDPNSAWSVPEVAAQADAKNRSYIWKVDSKTMKVAKCEVELGTLTGDRVLLKKGVKQGDMVAVSGVTRLEEGMQVRELEP